LTINRKAALIWGYSDDGFNAKDIELLHQYYDSLKGCCEVRIWGPPMLRTIFPDDYAGDCTADNLRKQCFNYSYGYLKGYNDVIRLVIDDYSYGPNGDIQFDFNNGDPAYLIDYSNIKQWLDDPNNMIYIDFVTVILGCGSEKALIPLCRPDRLTIASQHANECHEEHFFIHLCDSQNNILMQALQCLDPSLICPPPQQ